jgi:outer membrane protein TolC
MELSDANLRLAQQTLEAEEALASAGRNIQRDVLQARTEVDRAKADAAKARTDYRLAQAQLLRLQGQLDRMAP